MKRGRNHLYHTFALMALVVAALVGLHHVPKDWTEALGLRQVDIVADVRVRHEAEPAAVADTAEAVAREEEEEPARARRAVPVEAYPEGMTPIEDYSEGGEHGMGAFYEALALAEKGARGVRIAYFGDSFIEADILTGDLREMLQRKYGGRGVGFVAMASETSQYRQTVAQRSRGFERHAQGTGSAFDRKRQGLTGDYFTAEGEAFTELRGVKRPQAFLDTCGTSTLYMTAGGDTLSLSCTVNGEGEASLSRAAASEGGVEAFTVKGAIGQVRWEVKDARGASFYGIALDGEGGVTLDNLSMRGSSGMQLGRVPQATLRAFAELRPYDLIILGYGLNVAEEGRSDYGGYRKAMMQTIDKLKEAYPEASLMVVGVGDREKRGDDGEFETIDGVLYLLECQRRMAREGGVAFWDMRAAMGGEGGIVRMVESKEANRDYTHINFQGGKHLARLMFEALEEGKRQHESLQAGEGLPGNGSMTR